MKGKRGAVAVLLSLLSCGFAIVMVCKCPNALSFPSVLPSSLSMFRLLAAAALTLLPFGPRYKVIAATSSLMLFSSKVDESRLVIVEAVALGAEDGDLLRTEVVE